VHKAIAEILMRVVREENLRIIITAPPQVGKSYLVSVLFPAFYLAHNPTHPIILSSYGAHLAEKHASASRDFVESKAYATLFPDIKVRRDRRAKGDWALEGHAGSMLAVGVEGPITGSGGMLGLIDDPFENWKSAMSEYIREQVWHWFLSTFRTRIWRGGNIIITLTRWHDDDLAGRAIRDKNEEWEIYRFPALCESQAERDEINEELGLAPGLPDPLGREVDESLAPIRQPTQMLRNSRAVVGPVVWSALYQGFPREAKGRWFKVEMFPITSALPGPVIRRVRYWDKAATEGGGKYSVGVRLAVCKIPDAVGITAYRFVVEHVARGQWSSTQREAMILAIAKTEPHGTRTIVEEEPGSGGKESAENTIQLTRLEGYIVERDRVSGAGSKDVRLIPFHTAAGRFHVSLLPGEWNVEYIKEMIALPTSVYRDQGDATAGAFNRASEGLFNPYDVALAGSRL
jgi:phage terminase large subunit-like protein